MVRPARDGVLFKEVAKILGVWHNIPAERGFGGTGAPGRLLEHLLDIKANNQDLPDAGKWEVKFSSRQSYLTMFHLEPYPRDPCVVEDLVKSAGWKTKNGLTAFRHTIWGESSRGFKVHADDDMVTVTHDKYPKLVAKWDTDDLMNTAVTKLRNLLLVYGEKREGLTTQVKFNTAHAYARFRFKDFLRGLKDGWICIDFDARTKPNGSIRNHGTKFRIRSKDISRIYKTHSKLDAEGTAVENSHSYTQAGLKSYK